MGNNKIQRVLTAHGLGTLQSARSAQLTPTIGANATSETLHVQTDQGDVLVKFADAATLAERTAYHRLVASYLPLPNLIAAGEGYQVLEWIPGAEPLLSLVLEGQRDALDLYLRAAECLPILWSAPTEQKTQGGPSGNYAKNQKAKATLMAYLDGVYDLPIVINGTDTKLSVRDIFEATLTAISVPAPCPCATHGDPRLDNILVHPKRGVSFIDARPGFCDWLDDVVLLAWQRGFKIVKFTVPPVLRMGPEALEVTHATTWPTFVDEAEVEGLRIAGQFAAAQGDHGWRRRYHCMVAACALREIVSIQRRRKLGALGRDLPEGAEGFWIAEAVRHLELASNVMTQGKVNP